MDYQANHRPVDLGAPEVEWIVLNIIGLKKHRTGVQAQVVWEGDYEPTCESQTLPFPCQTVCRLQQPPTTPSPLGMKRLSRISIEVAVITQLDEAAAAQGIRMPPPVPPHCWSTSLV
jgi:hypothetical protein